MMALTGIVFAIGTVMVQFSAIAYSPRLALWLLRDRTLFHALGVFAATFLYALSTLAWIDRDGSGTVPLVSNILVFVLLIASMLLFSFLVQRLSDLQITNVLRMIGIMAVRSFVICTSHSTADRAKRLKRQFSLDQRLRL